MHLIIEQSRDKNEVVDDLALFVDANWRVRMNAFIAVHNLVHRNNLRQLSIHSSLEHVRHRPQNTGIYNLR